MIHFILKEAHPREDLLFSYKVKKLCCTDSIKIMQNKNGSFQYSVCWNTCSYWSSWTKFPSQSCYNWTTWVDRQYVIVNKCKNRQPVAFWFNQCNKNCWWKVTSDWYKLNSRKMCIFRTPQCLAGRSKDIWLTVSLKLEHLSRN